MTQTLAQRAVALTNLCDLAAQLGGSIRVADGSGTVFYRGAGSAERPIGGSVAEAASVLSTERADLLSPVFEVERGDLKRFHSVDALFEDLNADD